MVIGGGGECSDTAFFVLLLVISKQLLKVYVINVKKINLRNIRYL